MEAGKRRKMGRSSDKHHLYPLIAILSSVLIFAGAMISAKKEGYLFLAAVIVIFLIAGLWKELLKIFPIAIVLSGAYFGIAYAISRDLNEGIYGANRIFGLCLAIVPGLSIPAVNLSRCLNQLRFPRGLSVGILITLRFFPILGHEIKTIRSAMKTRGVSPSPASFYRSTILPFCLKLANISDLLALSLETRAFGLSKNPTNYKKVGIGVVDIIYISLIIASFVCALVFLPILGVHL